MGLTLVVRDLAPAANTDLHWPGEEPPLQRVGVLTETPRLLREMKIEPEPILDGNA